MKSFTLNFAYETGGQKEFEIVSVDIKNKFEEEVEKGVLNQFYTIATSTSDKKVFLWRCNYNGLSNNLKCEDNTNWLMLEINHKNVANVIQFSPNDDLLAASSNMEIFIYSVKTEATTIPSCKRKIHVTLIPQTNGSEMSVTESGKPYKFS